MASLNSCSFIGRIGKAAAIRTMNNGKRVASFSLAVDQSYKKDNQKVEKTEWVNVSVFTEGLVNIIEKYTDKGTLMYIVGQYQTRKWSDKDGVEKYTTEIVLQGFNSVIQLLGGKGLQDAGIDKALDAVDKARSNQEEESIDDTCPF